MADGTTLTAVHTIEVEIDVSGAYCPAEPDVGLGEGYEDLSVDGLFADVWDKRSKPFKRVRVDLLAGLDAGARWTVLANLEAAVGNDAIMEALAAEASDPMADRADDLRDMRRDDEMRGFQ